MQDHSKQKLTACALIIIALVLGFGLYTDWSWSLQESPSTTNSSDEKSSDESQGAQQQWGIKVTTQKIRAQSNDRRFQAIGTGQAQLSVDLYSSVAEDVTDVLFNSQQKVSQGDILFKLDDREELLLLKSAQIRLKEANRVLEEYSQALQRNAVPSTDVAAARAEAQQAEVALQQAQVAVDFRTIRAPFDGTVGLSQVDPGDRITAATLLAPLDNRSVMYVDFFIPESLAKQIQEAQNLERTFDVTTPAFVSRTFQASIHSIESRVESDSRTLLVRLRIDNEEDLLRPGMSFRVDWRIQGESFASVPEIAVQWGRDGPYIWVIREQRAQSVPVSIIARKVGRVLIKGEVQIGEQVVVEGVQRMRPDIKVTGTSQ